MASRHRGMGTSGNLRAAVFGVNDGLISNLSLILGVAAHRPTRASSCFRGSPDWLAARFRWPRANSSRCGPSARCSNTRSTGAPRTRAVSGRGSPGACADLRGQGNATDEALALARKIIADPQQALDTLAREELGLNPEDLGSPWGAAWSSFTSFALGAAIPLLPFALSTGNAALFGSIALTAVALFGVGAAISLFTGRNALRDGLRMLCIGAAAGGVTYVAGALLGAGLA